MASIEALFSCTKIPDGIEIKDLNAKSKNMKLVFIEAPSINYVRKVPHLVIPHMIWPENIDRGELDSALDEASVHALIQRIERLVSVRERSVGELEKRLLEEGFYKKPVEEAVERACAYSWVDDLRYASIFIKGKQYAGWGERRIRRELKNRFISEDVCEEAFHQNREESEVSELDRALQVLSKRAAPEKNPREKLYRRLASKGFSSEICSKAVSQFMSQARGDTGVY